LLQEREANAVAFRMYAAAYEVTRRLLLKSLARFGYNRRLPIEAAAHTSKTQMARFGYSSEIKKIVIFCKFCKFLSQIVV
jgi:hypothetical protein